MAPGSRIDQARARARAAKVGVGVLGRAVGPAAAGGDEHVVKAVHRFRAMGCEIVLGGGDPAAVAGVFARWEGVFSRFLPGSELTRVNASPAWALHVSPLFARALRVALEAAADTDGLVDPTLGAALEAAGYDADFSLLPADGAAAGAAVPSRLGELRLDGQILRRPPGLQLDLNGVVKALAVDEAVAGLPAGGFVSAGGDLAARGPVDVGLPGGGAVRVVQGGLATSGVVSRRWRRGGEQQHHLLDPRTGRPCRDSPWEQVTVSGASCLAADVAAKAAFLLGGDGAAWLDEHGMPGRFVTHAGDVVANDMWLEATSGAWHLDVASEVTCI
jgi:thiamine biosynthesis lipoprotein